jgi:hypothetical protein
MKSRTSGASSVRPYDFLKEKINIVSVEMGRDTVPPTPYIAVLCDLKRFKEEALNETTRLTSIDKMHGVHTGANC